MTPAGRPFSNNPKDIRFSIRLDTETNKQLSEYCEKHGIKKGEAIRRAIKQLITEE